MARNPLLVLLAVIASLLFTSNAHAVYNVQTGRFLQADPYATGLPILNDQARWWFHGRPPMPEVGGFNVRQHYRDGMNQYQYLRSNPPRYNDPLGLWAWELEEGGGRAGGAAAAVGVGALAGMLILFQTDQYQQAMMSAANGVDAWMSNQLAWGETLFQSAEHRIATLAGVGVAMASQQARAAQRAQSLIDQAITHFLLIEGTVASGNPNPDDWHHFKEIREFVRQVRDATKDMGRRTAEDFLRKANEIERQAERSWEIIQNLMRGGG